MLVSPEKRTRIFRMGKDEDMQVEHTTQGFPKNTTAFEARLRSGLARISSSPSSSMSALPLTHLPVR
jgi:hypothetical protein